MDQAGQDLTQFKILQYFLTSRPQSNPTFMPKYT